MEIVPVNFKYANISAISKKQFDVHLQLYKGYVKKINEIDNKLRGAAGREEADATYSLYRGLKKGETYSLDGVILHELYFNNLGGTLKIPPLQIETLLTRYFGSYENWVEDFIACGKAARGWAILAYDPRSKMLRNILSDAHDEGVVWTGYPIIIMDVYEHAYYIDYGNKKEDYIKNFIQDINWDVIARRVSMLKLV